MDLNQILKQIRIDIVLGTVFIQNRNVNFCYTIPKDQTSVENYFGGLQCEYDVDSPEYEKLENELCRIAWNVLNIYNNKNVNRFGT